MRLAAAWTWSTAIAVSSCGPISTVAGSISSEIVWQTVPSHCCYSSRMTACEFAVASGADGYSSIRQKARSVFGVIWPRAETLRSPDVISRTCSGGGAGRETRAGHDLSPTAQGATQREYVYFLFCAKRPGGAASRAGTSTMVGCTVEFCRAQERDVVVLSTQEGQ